MTISGLLEYWVAVEADFQQIYGIDLSDPAIRGHRSWRWFVVRLIGLLSTEGRIQRVFNPIKMPKGTDSKE